MKKTAQAPWHTTQPDRQSRRDKAPVLNADLDPHFVWWNVVSKRDVSRLRTRVRTATDERSMQKFLEANPEFLIQHLGGGHGRWVLPHQRLGSQFCTDFLIADRNSMGYGWEVVELESPKARMFTKRGDPTAALTHAIRQIADWRIWLAANVDYAQRSRAAGGLGLPQIHARAEGLILMSTRAQESPENAVRRRELSITNGIAIHTYDFLVEACAGRANALQGVRKTNPKKFATSLRPEIYQPHS